MANWSCQLWQLATAFDSGRAGFARQCRRVFEGDILFSSFSPSFRNANIWRIRYFVLALFALSFNCSIEHFPSVSSPFSDHKLLKWPLRLFFPSFHCFPPSLSFSQFSIFKFSEQCFFAQSIWKKLFIRTMLISETEEMSLTTIVIFTTTGPSAHIKNYLQLTILSLLMRLLASKVWSDVLCKRPKNNKGKSLSLV